MINFFQDKLSINSNNAIKYSNTLVEEGLCCIDRIFWAYESDQACLHKFFDEEDTEDVHALLDDAINTMIDQVSFQ